MTRTDALLEAELKRREIQFAKTLDGAYRIEVGGAFLTLSLDNIVRDFERDGDPERISEFVESSLRILDPLPPWAIACTNVYWSAEPADQDFGTELTEYVTDTVVRVLVFADFETGRLVFLTPKCEALWSVTLDDLHAAAERNLDRLIETKQLEIAVADDVKLATVPVVSAAEASLKASTIFAPGFKRLVERDIGWPVLVTIPCRDFIYVIAEADRAILGDEMAEVVRGEFHESGYPITLEVLRISDDGIESIGSFPDPR